MLLSFPFEAFGLLGSLKFTGRSGNVIEERAVTHRVLRIDMLSPYRFVAFSQHTRFVMLVYDVTDQLDASQRVDIPFSTLFAHSPKKSLSLSKLRPFDSLADFFGDGSFLFRLSGERLDLHRALVYLPDAAPAVADRTGTGRAACLRRRSVLIKEIYPY